VYRVDVLLAISNTSKPNSGVSTKTGQLQYRTSRRPYAGLSDLEYPFHDRTVTVTTCGRICIGRRKINLSQVFAGQNVGIKEVADKIWLVSFMHYDLGFFDHEAGRVECAPNPFGAKVLPMSPE
jgi:putative transposase